MGKKLISIKNKIESKKKLTLEDQYNLIFIPLMGNVDRVKAAFKVFNIANTPDLFSEDELENIKKCQYVMAQIIAGDDEKLFEKFLEVIKMFKASAAVKYEQKLIDQNTQKVTQEVTEKVTQEVTEKVTQDVTEKISVGLARNLKDVLSDEVIAQKTGLDIEIVKNL